ncbi:MAG TPA: retropepsin-like aspartic protease [Stellaceae bacterium]|nr:retropepsin-like aspartic protease [Stellaceae bacterium]
MTDSTCLSRPAADRVRRRAAALFSGLGCLLLAGCYPPPPGPGAAAPLGTAAESLAIPASLPPYGATEAIPLTPHGGVYTVQAEINGVAKLDFLIDTGSTDVVLPAQAVVLMLRAGALSESDFIGHAGYRLADGSVLISPRFMLREVRVGNYAVRNVTASVGEVQGLPLLGESFLSRFRSWAIDNNSHNLILTAQ